MKHPNAGGVLLVSLGCENNDLDHFLPVLGDYDRRRIRTLVTQDAEGDEIEAGLSLMREIAAVMGRGPPGGVSCQPAGAGLQVRRL